MTARLARLVLAVAIVAGAALGLAACTAGGAGSYEVNAEFDRAFNLFEGSRVRVLGVAVGTVEELRFEPGMDTVHARLRIDGDVELPAEVGATVVFGALLGERHVELDPPYTGGPRLEDGATIPVERTQVPAEFDEILESLNDFLEGLPPEEVARLVHNAADVLDGRGEELGETLEDVQVAVEVLRDNDEAIVRLASRLADLSATLATRDQQIGRIIEDWNTVVGTLAEERAAIDASLDGVARMSAELGDLLATNREDLEEDIRTVTRIGRTAERSIDELELLLLGQSELYRHAERVFDFERNWLPLVNHSEDLPRFMGDRLANRLAGLCDRLGIDECADPDFWEDGLPEEICIPGLTPCPGDEGAGADSEAVPLDEALREAVELVPALPDALAEERADDDGDGADGEGGPLDVAGLDPFVRGALR